MLQNFSDANLDMIKYIWIMRNILEIYKVDLKLQRNISENIKKIWKVSKKTWKLQRNWSKNMKKMWNMPKRLENQTETVCICNSLKI